MSKLVINGGKKLYGEIDVCSSKNAYLPILAGCILCENKIILHNYPHFTDTKSMCKILENLGGKVVHIDNSIEADMGDANKFEIPCELAGLLRSSIFALGAILGRFKKAKVAYPGGCEIGARPIDIHLAGLRKLGVKIIEKHGYIYCDGSNMRGDKIVLDFPSVGATENLMMASVLTKGETILFNVAKEPEIVDLQNFLNTLGAKISGAGTEKIIIQGVEKLHGGEYTPMRDRVIAGTYALAVNMCGGKVAFRSICPDFLSSVLSKLDCKIQFKKNGFIIQSDSRPKSISKIETAVYPGIPTDLQAQLMALQCISDGTSVITENLFESRYKHVPELIKMGADIIVKDRVAIIKGVSKLYGAEVNGADLRGTSALILAGLVAEGYTTVNNLQFIDRGYENIESELANLGADIKRL